MPPAQPTAVQTTLQMMLFPDAESNQECLEKDSLTCGQNIMGYYHYFLLLQDIVKPCSDESFVIYTMLYHTIKFKMLNV